jgi:hypothetical protein
MYLTTPHPNLVTASGLDALTNVMRESRTAYDAAQRIEDAPNVVALSRSLLGI